MEQMEQPDPSGTPAPEPPPPAPPVPPEPQARVDLPDPKGALAIPDQMRLPFHGKMVTPTSVPSAAERAYNLHRLQRRKRRRGFLVGLLCGQLLILAMDLGGSWFLRTHPHVHLKAPIGVEAVVFLGMALGSAVMIVALSVIFAGLGLRALFGRREGGLAAAVGRGLRRVVATVLVLGTSMAVILGTAWVLIPREEWRPTSEFVRGKARALAEASASTLRSLVRPPAPPSR